MYIYVQAQDGTPLMPTQRAGKVRRMLRDGRAVIISHTPFTIRLTYDTTRYTQPVSLGVDAGSKHIGIAATTQSKELYAAEVELRSDIVNNFSYDGKTCTGENFSLYLAPAKFQDEN